MKLKRFVSILLCALLALTPLCLPAGAADGGSGASYTADCPYVKVLGLMSTDIYADKDDPSQGTVWPPQAGVVVKDVLKLVPSLFELAITKNYGKFGPKLYDAVHDIFAPLYFYNEARVTNNSGPIFEYPAPDKIKKDSYVIFEYDWRLAPEELAAQLNDFIDYVLECSGSEQIVLECHSYGELWVTPISTTTALRRCEASPSTRRLFTERPLWVSCARARFHSTPKDSRSI